MYFMYFERRATRFAGESNRANVLTGHVSIAEVKRFTHAAEGTRMVILFTNRKSICARPLSKEGKIWNLLKYNHKKIYKWRSREDSNPQPPD